MMGAQYVNGIHLIFISASYSHALSSIKKNYFVANRDHISIWDHLFSKAAIYYYYVSHNFD